MKKPFNVNFWNVKFKLILIGTAIIVGSVLGYGIYTKLGGTFGAPTQIRIGQQTLWTTDLVPDTDGFVDLGSSDKLVNEIFGEYISISDDLEASGSIKFGSITGSTQCLHVDTNGVLSGTGADCGSGAAGGEVHGLLNTDWHTDVLLASVSQGSLIVGNSTPKWSELTIGASSSFLTTDGSDVLWIDDPTVASMSITNLWTSTLTGTLTGDLTCTNCLNATEIEDIYFLTAGDTAVRASISDSLTVSDIFHTNSIKVDGTIDFPDDSVAEADISFSTSCAAGNHLYVSGTNLACEADDDTTYTVDEPLNLVGTLIDIDLASTSGGGYLSNTDWDTFSGKWDALTDMVLTDTYIYVGNGLNDPVGVAMSNDCTISNTGAITCDHDALANFVANEHIDWTGAGAGTIHTDNYVEGITYTAGDNLTLTGTDFDVDDPFTITTFTTTHASISDDLTIGSDDISFIGGIASISSTLWVGGTLTGAGTINATTLTEGGIAVLNNDEMDSSAELLNIFDDETGTGVIVFGTSPQFTTSFTTAGVFAINPGGALTIGDGGDTLYLNSSDWDIGTTGDMTGIGAITADGLFTGTHASMSGDLDILGDINVTSVSAANFYGTLTGDLTCTDCLNATEIEDIYFLVAGDEMVRASVSDSISATDRIKATILSDGTASITGGIGSGFTQFTSTLITGTHVSASDDLTIAGVVALRSGGTLTSAYHCRADGTTGAIDCDRVEDASNTCAANAVCMGGHNHNELIDTFAELDAIVADKALVNKADGAVWSGVHDFGGATSVELPNGTSITLDANGEAGVDTTGGQFNYYSDGVQILMATQSFGFVVSSGSFDGTEPVGLKKFLEPVTITAVHCVVTSGTSQVITIQECDANGANCATTDAAITCGTTNTTDDGSLSNPSIDSGDWVNVDFGATTGAVDWLSVSIFYKWTAQ